MELILHGTPVYSFNNVDAVVGIGTAFALPARASLVTWQTSFTVAPGSITVAIETSVDGTVYGTVATSTAVGGAINTFETSARFIRGNITAETGSGTGTILAITTKAIG